VFHLPLLTLAEVCIFFMIEFGGMRAEYCFLSRFCGPDKITQNLLKNYSKITQKLLVAAKNTQKLF